jgi:hypothetical protein
MELWSPITYKLPRLGVQPVEYDETNTCRYGLFDTPLEAWDAALRALEGYRDRWADAAALAQRQVDDADMWLAEYRRNLSTKMDYAQPVEGDGR